MDGLRRGLPPDLERQRAAGDLVDVWVIWDPSPDEEGMYPVTYSVLRGELAELSRGVYTHRLVDPAACGLTAHEYEMVDQGDGVSYYYLVVPVSGDNATFGYDSAGAERPAAPVCE
jgi:hypothetical protein